MEYTTDPCISLLMCNGDALFKARTGFVQSTDCTLQSAASCTQGFTVMKPILTLTHERTWEQALAPHSKSVLYTVVRALEIKRQQLLYIHPEGQLKRLVWFVRDLAPLEDWTRLAGMESGAFVGSFFDIQLHLEERNKCQFCLMGRWMERSLQQAKEFVPSPGFPILIWKVFWLHPVSGTSWARMLCSPSRYRMS